ncbi:MAG: PrsW family glutamic-type intramembrane protease [Planctomycetota bacterium]
MVGYVMLALGGLLFGAMVYRYDMHEREPWWMLVSAVIAGGVIMVFVFLIEGAVQTELLPGLPEWVQRFFKALMAGTLEEIGKLAVPVMILLLVRKYFNDPMDGLVYGSMAGLGAALYESLWYTVFVHKPVDAPLLHEQGPNALRLLLHTVWGGIGGYALGHIIRKEPWKQSLAKCMGAVMLIHFVWDFFLAFVPPQDQNQGHKLVAAMLLAASIVWYGVLVVRVNKWSRAMHAPTSKQKLFGKIVRAVIFRRFK